MHKRAEEKVAAIFISKLAVGCEIVMIPIDRKDNISPDLAKEKEDPVEITKRSN